MKGFIGKILIFSFLFSFGVIGLILSQSFVMKRGNYYQLPEGTEGVILGHSHASCAYNDTLIHGVVNLAEPMEGYYYSFFKLKQILRHNKLKYVFVEYSNNQISQYADDRIYGSYIGNQLPKMLPFISPRDLLKIAIKNPIGVAKAVPVSLKMSFDFLTKDRKNYIQSHWSNDKIPSHILDEKKKTIQSDQNNAQLSGHIKNNFSVSDLNLYYLAQIAKMCKDNNIELYFLRAPVSKYYVEPLEPTFHDILAKEFPEVQLIDMNEFPLEDNDYADPQHMNLNGANKISKFLNDLIASSVRNKSMSINEFINQRL